MDGEWRYDSRRSALVWTITLIDDTNRNGSLEFVIGASDPDALYPIEVEFSSNKVYCDVAVESVEHTTKGGPVKFSSKKLLQTSGYQVV